jgi:hypothetical protein
MCGTHITTVGLKWVGWWAYTQELHICILDGVHSYAYEGKATRTRGIFETKMATMLMASAYQLSSFCANVVYV